MSEYTTEEHQKVAAQMQRDEHGHFVHTEPTPTSSEEMPKSNPISQFLHDETTIHKTKQDELIDIHVGNPLKRVEDLLQEIKKQKALTISGKLSFSIVGVTLAIGMFTIFGAQNIICNRGTQTKIGILKTLPFEEPSQSSWIDKIPYLPTIVRKNKTRRIILETSDGKAIHLIMGDMPFYIDSSVEKLYATGQYNSCSDTLILSDQIHSLTPWPFRGP